MCVIASTKSDESREAEENEFPYIVRIKSSNTRCIGTLVTYSRVVTAGRCFYVLDKSSNKMVPENLNKYAAYAGSVYFFSSNILGRNIKNVSIHPKFAENPDRDYYHDIALAELSSPFVKQSGLRTINLSDKNKLMNAWDDVYSKNKTCYAVGWSWNLQECDPKNNQLYLRFVWKYLQVIEIMPTTNSTCKKYAPTGEDMYTLGQVCTTGSNLKEGICGGDPGSPIICDGQPLGLHLSNLVCSQFQMMHFYQLFWPYSSDFLSESGFAALSGSSHTSIDLFLLLIPIILRLLPVLHY